MSEKKPTYYRRVLPDVCTSFASEKGKQLFIDSLASGYMNCYFPLASQFRTQEEPAYCGLSSLVMVLNALAVDPGVVWKGVFRWYHEDMLDCCTPLEEVKVKGVSMDNLMCLAFCNQLNGELKRVTDSSNMDKFRDEVKFATTREDRAIIVSYGRGVLGQTGTGHFSPIGGYNEKEDMVLIMDVARFKYPPYWVTLPKLWEAMNTKDVDTGLNRGYMILWRADTKDMPSQPPVLFKVHQRFNTTHSILRESGKFLLKMKSFLNEKTIEGESDDEILKHILQVFLKESFKEAKASKEGDIPSFLSLRITEQQVRTQFPEMLEGMLELIQAINDTQLCKTILKIFPGGICCEQALFTPDDGQHTAVICSGNGSKPNGDCVICLQHYLTVFVLSFPMERVKCCHNCHGRTMIKNCEMEERCEGTYYEFLKKIVDKELGGDVCCVDKKKESNEERRKLLVNEVTQLRRQFAVLMDACDTSDL